MGKIWCLKYIFLFFISLNAVAKPACQSLFEDNPVVKLGLSNWNEIEYIKTVEQVFTDGILPSGPKLKIPEVQLGLIQGLIKRSGLEGELKFKQQPKNIKIKNKMSEYKAQKLIEDLISLQSEKLFFLKRWFSIHQSGVSKRHIDGYIKQQLLLKEFLILLKNTEIYKPNSKLERVLQFLKDNHSYSKVFTSVLVNYFSIQWFGFPLYLPEFKFLYHQKLSKSQLDTLKSLSHSKRIQWVQHEFNTRVKIDRVLNFPRDAFPAFMIITIMYAVFNPVVHTPEFIVQSSDSEIYRAWIEMYKQENGHYPNVFFNTSDRSEWVGLYQKIIEQYSTH